MKLSSLPVEWKKAEMRFEGLARQKRFAKGAFRDVKIYAMLRYHIMRLAEIDAVLFVQAASS